MRDFLDYALGRRRLPPRLPIGIIECGPDTPPALRLRIERENAGRILPIVEPRSTLRDFLSGLLPFLRYPTRRRDLEAASEARERAFQEAAIRAQVEGGRRISSDPDASRWARSLGDT